MRLNAFHLKIIALTLMFIEHFGRFLPSAMPPDYPSFFLHTGRVVAPMFFFLAVESYFKTQHRRAYITRLFVWAGVMALGNFGIYSVVNKLYGADYAFGGEGISPVGLNIFLSIAIYISVVAVLEWTRVQSSWKKVLGCLGVLAVGFGVRWVEYSYLGLSMILVFYCFYNKKPEVYIVYAALCLVILRLGLMSDLHHFWVHESQWAMIGALPFFMLYNGERGPRSMKYLFYVFYPLHVWVLYYLSYATTF